MSGNFPPLSVDNHSVLFAEQVASFQNYNEAQRAIEKLSDAGFPVTSLAIVGSDVRTVERILGKLSVGKVFLQGFLSGLWLGLMAAIFVSLINDSQVNFPFLSLLVLAMALIYGLLRAVFYAASSHRHGYAAARSVIAREYTVVALENGLRAREILGVEQQRPRTVITHDGPTPFGSRPDEQPRFGVRVDNNEGVRDVAYTPNVPTAASTQPAAAEQSSIAQPAVPETEVAAPVGDTQIADVTAHAASVFGQSRRERRLEQTGALPVVEAPHTPSVPETVSDETPDETLERTDSDASAGSENR